MGSVTHTPKSGATLTGTEYEAADHHVIALDAADIPTHSHAGEDITSGTVADGRVASTLARDTEVTSAISTHEAASDPHTGYVREADANWVDLTDGGATTLHSHTGSGVTLNEVIDALYPVGSLYTSTLSTNPGTLLGRGTWAAFGAGRVMVGRDAGDADFDTAEETGGAKTKAISAHSGTAVADHSSLTHANGAVADHASHTHTYTQVVNHVHTLATGTGSTGNFSQVIGTVDTSSGGTGGTPTQTALGTLSGNPSGGVATGTTAGPSATLTHSVTQPDAHTVSAHSVTQPSAHTDLNVVQPYIVVYMWKRTA